jgi:hypothetical protein
LGVRDDSVVFYGVIVIDLTAPREHYNGALA